MGIDYRKVREAEKEARTPHLEMIKMQYVRSEVLMSYVLVDEFLNMIICRNYFGKQSFIKLWKTKNFRNFNHYILERLSLLNKLELVKAIKTMPSNIETIIKKMNDLRNGLAHSFFPQNLKRNKPVYNGISVFTVDGFKRFMEDREKVISFFLPWWE